MSDESFGSISTYWGSTDITKREFDHLIFLLAEDLAIEEDSRVRNLKDRLERLREEQPEATERGEG